MPWLFSASSASKYIKIFIFANIQFFNSLVEFGSRERAEIVESFLFFSPIPLTNTRADLKSKEESCTS
jgi:hypothetical protein